MKMLRANRGVWVNPEPLKVEGNRLEVVNL